MESNGGVRGSSGNGDNSNGASRSLPPNHPPPLPPRPSAMSPLAPGGSYYSSPVYNGYGSSMVYGGGSYSSPYNTYGMTPYYAGGRYTQESNIVRLAEESSRGAFQSVESVVQAFSSISMMLESSYSAVYNSFRAILGVADQFTRLKTHFSHIFTTLAAVKFLRWLYRRILVFLRLKPANYAQARAEVAWSDAQSWEQLAGSGGGGGGWSTLLFFLVVIGGPYLIYKLLAKIAGHVENSRKWAKGEGDHFEAKVLYSFNGVDENELSVEAGNIIRIAPKELQPAMRGWLMGSHMDGQKIGLVPMNYIQVTRQVNQKTLANRNNVSHRNLGEAEMEAAFNSSVK